MQEKNFSLLLFELYHHYTNCNQITYFLSNLKYVFNTCPASISWLFPLFLLTHTFLRIKRQILLFFVSLPAPHVTFLYSPRFCSRSTSSTAARQSPSLPPCKNPKKHYCHYPPSQTAYNTYDSWTIWEVQTLFSSGILTYRRLWISSSFCYPHTGWQHRTKTSPFSAVSDNLPERSFSSASSERSLLQNPEWFYRYSSVPISFHTPQVHQKKSLRLNHYAVFATRQSHQK